MPNGIVETFKKGYGFISVDGSGEQIFAHQNDIIEINGQDARDQFRHLVAGEKVSFETMQGDKGLKAINIKVLSERNDDRPQRMQRQPIRPTRQSTQRRGQSSDTKAIVERLIEVLSDENAPDGPFITRSETDYILNGNSRVGV